MDTPDDAPRSAVEELVVAVWADVLGRERIGIHEHFFGLGGNSLLAIQALARMSDAFELDLPVRLFFDVAEPTAANVAEVIVQMLADQVDSALLSEIEALPEDEVEMLRAVRKRAEAADE